MKKGLLALLVFTLVALACQTGTPRPAPESNPPPISLPVFGITPSTSPPQPPASAPPAAQPAAPAAPLQPTLSTPPPAPGIPAGGAVIDSSSGSCAVFPADNPWNRDVSHDPLDSGSQNYINYIMKSAQHLHADFGSNLEWGFPYVVVPPTQAMVPITFTAYGSESDPGPYPIPLDAPKEGGSDQHVLDIRTGECKLYELYYAQQKGAGWDADSGAVFDLNANSLRPEGWTSADAAGLPIFPGLVRYDEVAAGEIHHALRFTVKTSQKAYIHPATHWASSITDPAAPPMGLRLRLKAGYDTSWIHGQALVVAQALKKYGMIVADNGSSWFISGARDSRWNNEDLDQLKQVPGTAFEVVKSGDLVQP